MDCGNTYDKKRVLREIDEDFDITFNVASEDYHITHKGFLFQVVKWGEFTRDVVNNIRRVVWLNKNGDVAGEIDKHNANEEFKKEKKLEDMAYNMAKDIVKPLSEVI